MKIRTADALAEKIYGDLSWRRKELTTFRDCVNRADGHVKAALMRSSLALLYAHWEGFVKYSCNAYLGFLATQRLSYGQLRPEIAAVALRARMNELCDTNKPALHAEAVRHIRENSSTRARIPTRDAVRTNANLNYSTLCEILCSLGLDYTRYDKYADTIDEQLVAVRNRIAHGEEEYVRLPEWENIRTTAFDTMTDIAEQIITGAANKSYLAA